MQWKDERTHGHQESRNRYVVRYEDLRANPANIRKPVPAAPYLPPFLFGKTSASVAKKSLPTTTIVIDNGSGTVRAGWGGQFHPEIAFPSVVGKPGHEDHSMPLTRPIKRGAVVDLEGLEMLWSTCFRTLENAEELGRLDDRNLLLTCRRTGPFSNQSDEREAMAHLAFEKFGFGACYIAVPAVLSIYTTGCLTGVVVDSGYRVTDIVPVYEGYCMPRLVSRLNLGGRDLTEFLSKLLTDQIRSLTSPREMLENVRKIKEQFCYVAGNFHTESDRTNTKSSRRPEQYTLPDGHLVTLDSERFHCPEALFRPTLLGMESLGVAQATVLSIGRCDNYMQPEMLHHIALTGGNSLLKGFKERMWKDVVTITKKDANCWLPNPSMNIEFDATNAAWRGGSMLSHKPNFRELCISRQEYEEQGARIIRTKCF